MSRSDGFAVMDVSTDIVNDPKFRRLHRQHPEHVAAAFMAYSAVLGESWKAGRRVSVVDAWPALLPYAEAIVGAMVAAGLLDKRGQIPVKAWEGWFGPARKRREATRDRWRRANDKRLADSTKDSGATAYEPRGNSADTGAIPSVPLPSDTDPSDTVRIDVTGSLPDGDRDALDRYHELTGFRPWGIWSGDKLRALIADFGDAETIAALEAEHAANPEPKKIIDRVAARLARAADIERQAKKAAPRPARRGGANSPETQAVLRELYAVKPEAV